MLRFAAISAMALLVLAMVAIPTPRAFEAWAVRSLGLPNDDQLRVIVSHPTADIRRRADGGLTAYCRCPVAIPPEDIPGHLRQALVAIEDHRFETHSGVDYIGFGRALVADLSGGRIEGGSTLTQQLAKTIVGSERGLMRKVREALLARKIEKIYTKNDILALYFNRVSFGRDLTGVEQAARAYFGKHPRDLNVLESAMLAGMLKGPAQYDPLAHREAAAQRAVIVLDNMVEPGFLSKTAERRAIAHEVERGALKVVDFDTEYYLAWTVRQLGERASEGKQLILSLDPALQLAARTAIANSSAEARAHEAGEAALFAMDEHGAVLALVGGRDYSASQFERATMASRQIGSTFKPFIYLAALESGRSPESVIADAPITLGGWSPRNFDDRYLGRMTLTDALAGSRNAAAVRLAQEIGVERARAVAQRFGLLVLDHPSFLLGAAETSPIRLAAAYATLASGGLRIESTAILMALDDEGHVISQASSAAGERVADADVVERLRPMLKAAARHSLGALAGDAAGKSGTSNEERDAWFVGFSAASPPPYGRATTMGAQCGTSSAARFPPTYGAIS